MGTYTYSETEGNTTTTIEYSCEQKSMQYTIIGENIKQDFDFLLPTGRIAEKLTEALEHIKNAAAITTGFNFDNKYTSIEHVHTELDGDIKKAISLLDTLHSALIRDIDNVNAELDVNFGHWVGYNVNEAGRKTTTTPAESK